MGCWTHHNMWLLFIAGLQVGLLAAVAPDSTCNPSSEFSCRNNSSICISLSRVKDGTPDCPDKSDEECNKEEFQCQSIHQCIPKERFHDGWPDCDDGSDEECGRGQFRCRCGVPHCIEGSKVKDGVKDCDDGSDEVSAKSRNKTARCPDESRLQDLLAVERKRRKRQIDALGASFAEEENEPFDGKLLNLQPSMSSSSLNNFQYSYTKFLNERLARDMYEPEDETLRLDGKERSISLDHRRKTLSTKPFMVRAETDSYGSLNSGKIYQTAVNEPVSVVPTAEFTVLEFDSVKEVKKTLMKQIKEKKKSNEFEPRRLSDLMQKIAALFQNDSESSLPIQAGTSENVNQKNKVNKNMKVRKLLSVADELQESADKNMHKRSIPDFQDSDSHRLLPDSSTIPDNPESNVHTTGIVMSTTGTDVIDGRTTEWTTIIEGTFISGTYAHIVHSTSKIYYTVETLEPIIPTQSRSPTIETSIADSKNNPDIDIEASSVKLHETESIIKTKDRKVEKISRTQRRNDKSLKALDDFIEALSSSKALNDFDMKPTDSFSSLLDITTVNDELEMRNTFETSTFPNKILINSLLTERNDFVLPTAIKDIGNSESTVIDSMAADFTKLLPSSVTDDIMETLPVVAVKDIGLSDEGILISENKHDDLNIIGRMVGNLTSETILASPIFSDKANELSSIPFSSNKEDMPLATSVVLEFDNFNNSSMESKFKSESVKIPDESIEIKDAFHDEITPSSTTFVIDDTTDIFLQSLDSKMSLPIETSLRIPDVTDLLVAFNSISNINNNEDLISSSGTNSDTANNKIIPTPSSSFTITLEGNEQPETSDSISNTEIVTETSESTLIFVNPSKREKVSSDTFSLDISSDIEKSGSNPEAERTILSELNPSSTQKSTETVLFSETGNSDSEVMVFLGIASTLSSGETISKSIQPSISSPEEIGEKAEMNTSELVSFMKTPRIDDEGKAAKIESVESSVSTVDFTEGSTMTVLVLPSMGLDDLKSLMASSSENEDFIGTITSENIGDIQSSRMTPVLDDFHFLNKFKTENSGNDHSEVTTLSEVSSSNNESTGRAKRAVSESVTILRPEGRIVSTDARFYLTPTTLYTTYTYFTTVLIPGGGSTVRSSLHVDSVVVQPTDRAVYGYDDQVQPCNECRTRNTVINDNYDTHYISRTLSPDHYHVETVPYDAGRASEITHRTTYTYYTTRFRGGTPFIETRKETKTDVTHIPSVRYSPFEIGTYYDGDLGDFHYHTEPPHIAVSRPHDTTHRTAYTFYTPGIRGGHNTVGSRRQTETIVTPIRTLYRPHAATQPVRTLHRTYSQPIDPVLYKPDRVTHRTTYTYHTTRFRDGVPIVNTREETETNVTPIPTYTRPAYPQRRTTHRIVPSRPATYAVVTETYNPYVRQGSNPYITHRTTYTYFTTRLIGGSPHVDTSYVTETNITPNPTVPYLRSTTYYDQPNYDDGYYETECPVCRENQRTTVTRQIPHTRVRGRHTERPYRRSDAVEPEVRPSTATLFSTYTYATTQLTRGGRPVVRTREHTVTEVLSDVVLPTLKFGDRIRSKRTVKPEDVVPKNTVYADHIVPIRHTFSRTNSYADGRQGRHIAGNGQSRNQPDRINHNYGRRPVLNKVDSRNKENKTLHRYRPQHLNENNNSEIKPTSITYYSTYTYFTTELQDGTPIVKSREHTVTEILTDVIVPTVSAVTRSLISHQTKAYDVPSHNRHVRDLSFDNFPQRRLLSVSEDDLTTKIDSTNILKSSISFHSNAEMNTPDLEKSVNTFTGTITPTPPLSSIQNPAFENKESVFPSLNNEYKLIESQEDLLPAAAEIRRVVANTPVTHYTTYTYYATKIKPGGSRVIETSTKVSSSVSYPQTVQPYDQVEYTRRPYKKRVSYASHPSQPERTYPSSDTQGARRRVHQKDTIYGLGSQAVHRFGNPYQRHRLEESRTCSDCKKRYQEQRKPYDYSQSYDRMRVPKDHYLTRIPVRNRNNNARRISDKTPNNVNHPISNVKPTRVTYYSTYTYFTTEPIDGTSVVRSREHTVTEILTDVIVPTVVSLNRVQATAYDLINRRSKRDNLALSILTSKAKHKINKIIKRKLLSIDVEIFSNRSSLAENGNFENFTTIEPFLESNTFTNKTETASSDILVDNENFSLLKESRAVPNRSSLTENENFENVTKTQPFFESNKFTNKTETTSDILADNENISLLEEGSSLSNSSSLAENENFENFTTTDPFLESNTFTNKTETTSSDILPHNENFTLLEESPFVSNSSPSKINITLQSSEILNNETSRFFENNDETTEDTLGVNRTIEDYLFKRINESLKENLPNVSDVNLKNKLPVETQASDKQANSEIITSTITHTELQNINSNDDVKATTDDIKPSSTDSKSFSTASNLFIINTEKVIDALENTPLNTDIKNIVSDGFDGLKSSFLDNTNFLGVSKTAFPPLFTEPLTEIYLTNLETPSIEKIKFSETANLGSVHIPKTSNYGEIFSDEDLEAEGAELRHAIVATPTTHYTTYTYYSTVLKPGGKREILTNTKVLVSTYYPDTPNSHRHSNDYHIHKHARPRTYSHTTKLYDLQPERAIARPQYVYQPSKASHTYKPSFATNVRRPVYEANARQSFDDRRCSSCERRHGGRSHNYIYDRHNRGQNYLTSVPVRRMTNYNKVISTPIYGTPTIRHTDRVTKTAYRRLDTQHKRISYPNAIPYDSQEITPTRVTYYSTYTYFTTELQGGSPVVRSREHTVTEILTDVIVPTVTSLSHGRATKYSNLRGKRYVSSEENYADFLENSPLQRKLFSFHESDIDEIDEIPESDDGLKISLNNKRSKSIIDEELPLANNLVASLTLEGITPTKQLPGSTSVDVNDDFLNNAQFSKAFAAYLAFLESSGAKSENTTDKNENITNVPKVTGDVKLQVSSNDVKEASSSTSYHPKSETKNMTSVMTSSVKKNGRMTKYTTTIYGTYINGVYAQRAKSTSEIIPITEMNVSPPVTTLMFTPSRLPGLVHSIVSRKIRGPVAVHLTTEIHGTFVGGAYAQTARVFTSSQPLSSTRDSSRYRIPSYSTPVTSGTRKTGLLSTRILRSKVDGSTTLLFVSEIYGTHIGGAYAHLGTYTTRTIIQTPSSTFSETQVTSTPLSTYYMEDLTTGLVTESLSEKSSNGITTRYHYQVFGTYLDGTYAHVPSISTETLAPRNVGTLSPSILFESSLESTTSTTELLSTVKSEITSESKHDLTLKSSGTVQPKLGLIQASTRAHVSNGTTTQHIFEVYGTFLNGNYAHVPSISVVTIKPSAASSIETLTETENQRTETFKSSKSTESFYMSDDNNTTETTIFQSEKLIHIHTSSESDRSVPTILSRTNEENFQIDDESIEAEVKFLTEPDFEVLTIFSDEASKPSMIFLGEDITIFPIESGNLEEINLEKLNDKMYEITNNNTAEEIYPQSASSQIDLNDSKQLGSENPNQQISNPFPILLPEALRLSLSHDTSYHRVKRNDPFSPYLRSSFTESIKSQKETQHSSLTLTTPLPSSIFSELSMEFIKNTTKIHSSSKTLKDTIEVQNKKYSGGHPKRKLFTPKSIISSHSKSFYLKRSKRAAIRSSFGSNKRFGSSSSSTRIFSSSNAFKRDSSSSSTRGYRANSNKNSVAPTKVYSSTQSKTVPNFLARPQRSKFSLPPKSTSSVVKSTAESSTYILPSRSRKFGKKETADIPKIEEDFDASETVPQSITREKIKPSVTSSSRFRRPSKMLKFNTHSSLSSMTSSSNKLISPSRRSRINPLPKSSTLRNRKPTFKDYDYDIKPTSTLESIATKRRFTLTTTFEINLKSASGYLTSLDSDEGNTLQELNESNKRRNKNRNSSSNFRSRQGSTYKPVFDNDDNEVRSDKPKSLPLPVFGRSRGLKRPPKFDPRTIKASNTATTSTIIYFTSSINETDDLNLDTTLTGPITVTDIFTTVKTLPVHLGGRTSFATITTTAFTTSTIQPDDLTYLTLGGVTKTLLTAVTGFPDANLPADKQFTVVTEVLLTTTEIESTSLVAIKVGFGTRTDTVVRKQKMTTLATETNTIMEEKSTSLPFQQQYPYFPNPFAPPIPPQNGDFSLSLSENSFVSTQTITSTTILPLFFNGKTILTTLTSTSLSEETLVKTTTFKVPQQPTMQPFIFPQPVFILPSVTTELTLSFTAHNGEVYSIVTQITVPLALNGHTRFARSVSESFIDPTISYRNELEEHTLSSFSETLHPSLNAAYKKEDFSLNTLLKSSFSINEKSSLNNKPTEYLDKTVTGENKTIKTLYNEVKKSNSLDSLKTETDNLYVSDIVNENTHNTNGGIVSFKIRKLLQFDEDETFVNKDDPRLEDLIFIPGTQNSNSPIEENFSYVPDTFHLIGPGYNEEGLNRPIPSVRRVPTRRAYVRRLKPSASQNLPFDGNEDEFNFRRNNQNFPANVNIQPGTEFNPLTTGRFPDENIGLRRNVPIANRPLVSQEGPVGNYGNIRNMQYFSPNRPNPPTEFDGSFSPPRLQPNFASNRPNRLQDGPSNFGRNPATFPTIRNNRPSQAEGFDALRNLPSYSPTRQNVSPPRDDRPPVSNQFGEEGTRNQVNRPQSATTSPRRVIRLRRPNSANTQQSRPQSGRELLDRKPIINTLPDEKESIVRARGPVILTNSAIIRDSNEAGGNEKQTMPDSSNIEYTEPLPLTYYTTFTYMTTFLNGPSTAYSTREAVVSNIATETVNPRIVGLIRTRGGFTQPNGAQTAVPLGSRAQGATTTIVNLASRIQLYNSDVYYGRPSKSPEDRANNDIVPTATNLRTIPITDVASLPKTYYTLFTYFYTLRDGDKSSHSQRSETVSSIDTQTEPFISQDFASTIDGSGFLTLKPNKQIVNLGLRTAGGTTTEVNLELKTVVQFDGLKNAVIDRGSMTPTLVDVLPSETNAVLNNYLDPDDAEVQDQQTYPQTVPIQPSFSSANEVYAGTQRSSSNKEATPEIPSNNRIIRTQSVRGPLRIASTVLQRPGTIRSGVFAPRPGVRVRVRPVSSRVASSESPGLLSSELHLSSYSIRFDPSRTVSENDFDDDDSDVTEEDDASDEYTTEETKITEEDENKRQPLPGRKRLKITIRRSPGVSESKTNSAAIRPTRTRPRFYVVTRTASPTGGSVRQPKRPVSVKVSRRLRPSGEPEYETYTTVTSVPVVFGLSTTYRNAVVTSSSLVTSDVEPEPSKTVVLTYFTTTTYTVPYTVDGVATYTTLEETNSRVATETLDPDADLSFISTTTLDYSDEISVSSADLVRQPPQTLKPQLVNNQLNVGPRLNLMTKVSNGVTLIVASDGENEATEILTQPTLTLSPTLVTDALFMTNKDITTTYEPRTFYTTFTFFTTFFSGGTPSISTSEQVITNVYSVPVTHTITRTASAAEPVTVIETSENLVSKTVYTTHTFYATLFNGTGTIVTPIEELQSSVISSTETYTITKTIMPEMSSEVKTTIQPSTTTSSVYRTRTNYVTLFRGTESVVSPLEEIETDIVTLTLDNRIESSKLPPKESYTTRTIQATNTHYITLFSGSESILSSITEVAPSVITELVKQLQAPTTTPSIEPSRIQPTSVISGSSSNVEQPVFQDLVPSIRTQYTTLTYFTTLFTDSSTILSSREEIATSYITLFVPAPAPGATKTDNMGIFTSQTDTSTETSKTRESLNSLMTPTSEILTFYTTYTYYTTLFRGTETIISDSETIVTQYVTIESTPTDSGSRHTTSVPPTFSRPNYSNSFEIRTESSPSPSVTSPTFASESSKSTTNKDTSDENIKIIGVSTKVESDNETPSILTGIPSTDANGATHILFTDFIVPSSIGDSPALSTDLFSDYITPSLPDLASSGNIVTEPSSVLFGDTTFFPHESSTPSSARDSAASDLATTRLTDNNVATHHMVIRPTTSYQSGSSQTVGIKPGAVIDLSDVLTNTNLVGNLGETIKDIVNLFAANGNRAAKNSTSKSSQSSSDTSVILPSGGITISSAEDPVFIPIGAIARSTKVSSDISEANAEVPRLQPSTMLSGFTPIVSNTHDANNRKDDSVSSFDLGSGALTSIVFGSNTIFLQPTSVRSEIPATVMISEIDGRFHNSFDTKLLHGSEISHENSQRKATPIINNAETTSLITGLETIFFGFPDARQPPQATTQLIQGSGSTSSIVGYETIFFDSPKDFYVPGSNKVNITGATTIFGTFPILTETSTSSSSTPKSTLTSTSSGETTIFFPVPGDNQQQNPGTRYVTSVESVTLTLTLTTSSVYQTEDTPVTVTSVFTTTIPPRTFVSTIIGDRTILGTQPEPTEAVQVIPTMQPSESTTTVTTTTLIFNSIATTVVRTLVIPTNAIQPTKPSTTEATGTVKLGGIGVQPNERPRVTTERTTPKKPFQLFKSGTRPTDPTTPKPLRTGPPLKLFPTKPPTTTTKKPPQRPVTTRKTTFRKPGKTLVPITDGCPRECNLKNKEVCKQNPDKSWSCQCRPGFFKKNGSEECKDVKSFVVLVRVLKMGEKEVKYSPDLSNHLSQEYKNLTTTARKAVDDAYKTSSVGDDFVSTNVLSVTRDSGLRQEGVLVNLTVQLSGDKPANEEFLKEELAHSLEAASSEVSLANASVSAIIQRVEDVQDFDECYDDSYNDCSRSAQCINLPGTYTCQCKEGYQDLEPLLPGRICSGEIKDCDYCNNRGVCIMTEDDNKFCRCDRMYLGKQCEINGLVLAIALPIALALLILTMFCLFCGCRKLRERRAQKPKPNVFKGMVPPMAGTLDRKAMIMDSSSESSGEHRPPPAHAYDGFNEEVANSTMKRSRRSDSLDDHISEFQVPTVLIPRAKHSHPKQVTAPYSNYRMPPRGDMDRW